MAKEKQYFVFFKDLVTQLKDGIMRKEDKKKLDGIDEGANKTVVDTALSKTSKNPVQNSVIATEIENLKKSGSDSKSSVAVAITGMGVPTATDADFPTIADNIRKIGGDANISAGDVLSGKVAYAKGTYITGSMPNNGAKTAALDCGDSYTIPAGYHNGAGRVSANSLASQTPATAAAEDILSGKTAYVNGSKVTGSVASKAAATYTPGTTDQEIAAKQYLSGKQTIKGDSNLVAANIKKGASIFGVAGSFSEDGTAGAGDILSGKIAYVNGSKITGNIASKEAKTYTPTTTDQEIAAKQYLSGKQIIKGDANLIAANIKKGVSIFGVSGNLEGGGNIANALLHDTVFDVNMPSYGDGRWYTNRLFMYDSLSGCTGLPTSGNPGMYAGNSTPTFFFFDEGIVKLYSQAADGEYKHNWIYGSCPSYVKIFFGGNEDAPKTNGYTVYVAVHANMSIKYCRTMDKLNEFF